MVQVQRASNVDCCRSIAQGTLVPQLQRASVNLSASFIRIGVGQHQRVVRGLGQRPFSRNFTVQGKNLPGGIGRSAERGYGTFLQNKTVVPCIARIFPAGKNRGALQGHRSGSPSGPRCLGTGSVHRHCDTGADGPAARESGGGRAEIGIHLHPCHAGRAFHQRGIADGDVSGSRDERELVVAGGTASPDGQGASSRNVPLLGALKFQYGGDGQVFSGGDVNAAALQDQVAVLHGGSGTAISGYPTDGDGIQVCIFNPDAVKRGVDSGG